MSKNIVSGFLFLSLGLLAVSGAFVVCCAEENSLPEYTNRMEVMRDEALRRDFLLQGEYLGERNANKIGLQLIADGDGKFRFVSYRGGLPGDGWTTGGIRYLGKAVITEEGKIKFETEKFYDKDNKEKPASELPERFRSYTANYKIDMPQRQAGGSGQRASGQPGFQGPNVTITRESENATPMKKVMRRSPTLGEKAPEGALVIFDGSNVDQFAPGAKINESRRPGGNTLWCNATIKPFEQKPYHLHLEFLLSYMPTAHGQARSNSGIYIDEAYECQVLDSFGLELANNECGGFYQVKEPSVNMCFPPLTWQTYDFYFQPPKYDGDKKTENARLTLKQNGVTIHDNIELPKETPGCKKEANEPRGVYLQGHGNKVQYRNIWLKYE
ncbi:MAG: DUF1080 domain-containing protein [Planctomycetaceae bacterium]|nr:DUF1080 domain-containing protein [Planctomycetaceae bacterium]